MGEPLLTPGNVYNVQSVSSLIYEPKAIDGLYVYSGYLDVWPVNGTTRGNQAGTFKLDATMKAQNFHEILLFIHPRIYNARTRLPLDNDSKVFVIMHFTFLVNSNICHLILTGLAN